MKKKKYLPLYYKWMKNGKLPEAGLCNSLANINWPQGLFEPDPCDFNLNYWGYWAQYGDTPILSSEVDYRQKEIMLYGFNPLRQNILLLMAAMNNEL